MEYLKMEKIKKYSNEYEYLIHLIKCAIHDNQPDEKPDALSFDKVFEYGKEHEVANIAFVSVQKLKSKPDNDLYKKWKMMYAFSIQRHAKQMHARNEMVEAFNHAQIRNVEVQGSRLKTLYPEPGWRMMSDIDFIIDIENLFHAEKILCDLGYNTKNVNDAEVDGFGANGIAIEIHTDFFHSNTKFSNILSNVFDTAKSIDGSFSYRADDTVFYLYNMLHLLKHFSNRGAGIRRILDVYILHQYMDEINIEYVNKVFEEFHFQETIDTVIELSLDWFGNVSSEKDLEEIKNMVYLSGNHGTAEIYIRNEYKKSGISNKYIFKIYKIMSLVFPKKEIIYNAHPYCKEQQFPIVFCWIYRAIAIINNKTRRKKAWEIITNIIKAQKL